MHAEYVTTDTARFSYATAGSGPPVVLVPGSGGWPLTFSSLLPELAAHHTVYAVDPPGQGGTRVTDSTFAYDTDAIATSLASLLEVLDLPSAAIVGHSWGGGFALWLAELHPDAPTDLDAASVLSKYVRAHASTSKGAAMSTTQSPQPTRTLNGEVLPTEGTWEIDPGHTDLAFTGRHMMFTKVRGRFTDVAGAVTIAPEMNDSRVEVSINMASVDSGSRTRDDHIRSAELFDVERFPTATFTSTSVDWKGSRGVVLGDLTIHGVTRQVPLEVSFEGYARDPWGGDRAVFSAHTKVNREDFGITWNLALEAGGVLVSKEVQIDIDLETVLQ